MRPPLNGVSITLLACLIIAGKLLLTVKEYLLLQDYPHKQSHFSTQIGKGISSLLCKVMVLLSIHLQEMKELLSHHSTAHQVILQDSPATTNLATSLANLLLQLSENPLDFSIGTRTHFLKKVTLATGKQCQFLT